MKRELFRLPVVAALALAAGLLVAVASGDGDDGDRSAADVIARPSRPAEPPRPAVVVSPVAAASDDAQSASPLPAAMTACMAQARQWRVRAGLSDLDAAAATSLEERSRGLALDGMAASADPIARAAAEYFPAQRQLLALADGAACAAQDVDCRERTDAARAALSRHAERLVGHALATADATAYGWAHRVCAAPAAADVPACQLVSAGQWVRLAPGNAAPWLAVAREARRGNDPARLDEAMFQVASATRHDGATFTLAALLAAHASPDDGNPFGALLLAAKGNAFGSMADVEDMQAASAYCAGPDLADSNRREVCQRVATLLAERSSTLQARTMARGLGKRLGWPAERLLALQQQGDALMAALTEPPASSPSPSPSPACTAALRDLGHLRVAARWGEVEALRRRVDDNPLAETSMALAR